MTVAIIPNYDVNDVIAFQKCAYRLDADARLDVMRGSLYNLQTMNIRTTCTTLFLSALFIFTTGCVSSLLKEAPPTFSSDIRLPDMQKPFSKLKTSVFPAWKNSDTNNVVTVISDCNDSGNSLKSIHALISESVENLNITEEKDIKFQSQPAYSRTIKGNLGDHPIAVQSLSFKRKNCMYLASLTGAPEKLNADKANFQNFLDKIEFEK